ncbi:FAD-dependent oxidoreductase [Jeotgalibaca sp. MA1X17-3]|uniref:FAD-dependent oxidoreductase n=1 Tax=Jeotgalibaca sp. MA1X17-3 TaxID=2908211 RepID=UPI001F24A98A|nr:FAD-dependent oxidoreductase [Jeotgalibaca sp. MA1X17-3]UJF16617.1 FAD-dependent oxidoreductase [Jeotgalibaca sp. MA1X17-3]
MKVIVIGSSHAGYEAVQTVLKEQPEAEIHLYEKGTTVSFLSCGIQSYLEGVSNSLDELHYANEKSYTEQGMHVHTNSEVIDIDPKGKSITVKTSEGESTATYDKLILTPGAVPFELPVEGTNLEQVFYLRGREWADQVKKRMNTAKKAVVIGAGYIGIEVMESFVKAGIETTIIDNLDHILPTYLDEEFTSILEKDLKERNVQVQTGEMVKEIVGENGAVTKVITNKGEYEADTVMIAAGITPATKWLKDIVKLDSKGMIEVDEYMQTSEADIFAAGDATTILLNPTQTKVTIPLASNARRQGIVAARNIVKPTMKMMGVQGTSGLSLFDYHFATTGVKAIDVDQCKNEILSSYVEEKIRPDFMHEEDNTVKMKIYYEKDSHIIKGAQLMSKKDVIASINTMAVVIEAEWTLEHLARADFFFQPEYNRPWNYLNVLAMQALDETYGSDQMLF